MILEDPRNFSKLSKQYNESNQSQNKGAYITHSMKYKKNNFRDGSNYTRTNKIYSQVSLQNTNTRVRSQSNGLDYDKNNYIHTDSGNNF